MASYAVLGATGSTGSSLIRILLQSQDAQVRAYCRSKQKLNKLLPEIVEDKNLQVFEGSLENVELMTECIRGTRAVFLAVGTFSGNLHHV